MKGNGPADIDEFIRHLHIFTHITRHNLEKKFVKEVSEDSVSFVQMNLMRILLQNPGQTVGNIAKFMNVSYPAATKTIDKLVKLGFLKRKEDTHDRRIAHLFLTQSGERAVKKYADLRNEVINKVIDNYGYEKTKLLNDSLREFSGMVVKILPINAGVCMECGAFDPAKCTPKQGDKSCGLLDSEN